MVIFVLLSRKNTKYLKQDPLKIYYYVSAIQVYFYSTYHFFPLVLIIAKAFKIKCMETNLKGRVHPKLKML